MLPERAQAEQKTGIEGLTEREQRISNEFSKVCEAIDEWKTDMIKWMFIFAVANVVTTLGILSAFFKK